MTVSFSFRSVPFRTISYRDRDIYFDRAPCRSRSRYEMVRYGTKWYEMVRIVAVTRQEGNFHCNQLFANFKQRTKIKTFVLILKIIKHITETLFENENKNKIIVKIYIYQLKCLKSITIIELKIIPKLN